MFSPSCVRLRTLLLPCLLAAVLLILLTPHAAHAEPIDDGLVGYWTFDEGTGGASADASGSGNTATLVTPNSFTNATPGIDAANPFAFAANGTATAYATAPGKGIDDLPQFTVAAWFRIDGSPNNRTMDFLSLPGGKVLLEYYDNNNLALEMYFGTTGFRTLGLSHPVLDGKFHHAAGTFDGRFMRFYLDGSSIGAIDTDEPIFPKNGPSVKGNGVLFGSPTNPFNGVLDDVRVYNRALSGSEVAALVYNCAAVQDIPASECRALVTLYANTDGANWTNHTNWLQNATACTWAGVLCNNGHVFALSLPQNNLRGALNPTLGKLTELGTLDLSNNALTGSIPFELGSLGKLLALGLGGNQFSGQIPFTLGNLAKLQSLQLQANQLRSLIPPQLANLSSLVSLDLGYNMLSAVDPMLIAFLNAHQPNWAATQTVPPANLVAKVTSSTTVTLSWQPTTYTGDTGYYEVLAAPQATGIYTSVGKTADKAAAGLSVTGLNPNATYTFLVRTFTAKHSG